MKKSIVIKLVKSYIEKSTPFIVSLHSGERSQPSKFVEEDSECLIIESILDGLPAAINYEDIANLLPVSTSSGLQLCNPIIGDTSVNNSSEKIGLNSKSLQYWYDEYDKAVNYIDINCSDFKMIDRRDTLKVRVRHTKISKDWARIDSMFNDAKKNNSLKQKSDKIIAELNLLPQCTEVKISLGMVYTAINKFDIAAKEFYNGGDYHNAAFCAMKNGDNKAALQYLKCLIKEESLHDINELCTFFLLSRKCKDIDLSAVNFKTLDSTYAEVVFYGVLTLYQLVDNDFSELGKPSNDYLSNISVMSNKLHSSETDNNIVAIQLTHYSSISDFDESSKVQISEKSSQKLFGEICSLKKNHDKGYGVITTTDGGQISYNICQVENEKLRNLLWTGDVTKIKVYFALGIGVNGQKVADHINLSEEYTNEEFSTMKTICDGMVYSYNNYDKYGNRYGVILSNNKDVIFRDDAVIDPVLNVFFENNFNTNVNVKFIGRKEKKNRIALKIWLDVDEEKAIFDKYRAYISKKKYEEFIEKIYAIEQGVVEQCPYGYVSLPAWNDDQEVKSSKEKNTYIDKSRTSNLQNNNDDSYLSINELLSNGTRYLTVVKNLEKAESCFLSVLERDPDRPHINTAVSNLVTIYQQENRADDALTILQRYKKEIDRDKYNNQLLQVYDKFKRYEDLINLLKEVIPNAGKAKPHRIKQLITCYLKINNASEAMRALKKYKSSIDELSYNNFYSSLLEMLGKLSELESFFNRIIESTYRVEYKLNYMNKLALFYQKNEESEKAISIYEQWKKYYISNRSNITTSTANVAIAKLEIAVDRNLCILYYVSDKRKDAKLIARELLRKNSEDSIAQQILDDTYMSLENSQSEFSENVDDYIGFEGIDDSNQKKLLEWLLNNIEYKDCLYNTNILNNIIDARYIADESQAEKDIEEAVSYFQSRSSTEKSNAYLALAKIIKQFLDSGRKDYYITQKRLNLFLGNSLVLKADADLNSAYKNRENSRYYYFLSLRYLSRTDDMCNFNHAINMLYYSFFLSDNELSETSLNKSLENNLCLKPPEYQDSVLAIKELMTFTFELYINYRHSRIGDKRIVRNIVDNIFANNKLRRKFSDKMLSLHDSQDNCQNADDYFRLWENAKNKYNALLNNLQSNIIDATKYVSETEHLNHYINNIEEQKVERILSLTDIGHLKKFLDIFKCFQKTNELAVIDEMLNELDKAVDLCESLEKSIHENPTDFSYEKLLDNVNKLKNKALKRKNDLFRESKPNLSIYPESTAFFKSEQKQAKVTVYIENHGKVQKADISNIVLSGVDNGIEIIGNPEHTITTVRGQGKDEYTVDISFTEKEQERKVFDINFSFEYSYYDGNGEQIKSKIEEVFQINLSSIESFVKISNKFSAFADGGAVESDDMFFGREKEINSIVDSLDQGEGKVLSHRGIYMYGQKRAGKSSIQAHLARSINDRYPGKYIILNLGSIGQTQKHEIWLKMQILNKLNDELEDNYPNIYDEIVNKYKIDFNNIVTQIEMNPDTTAFENTLNKIERLFPDMVIMIFVDEFTYIYESIKKKQCVDTFPHFWKALLQNNNVCSVIIGQDSMVNFAEEYANDFACMKKMFVSYLDEDGAKRLISEPIKDNGQNRFEDEALDLIYQLTAGSAYLIMIICSQLVDYMNERGTSRVTKTTIEIFLKNWLMNTSANSQAIDDTTFDPQLNDPCFFENFSQISTDNKLILTYIANHCNINNQIKVTDVNCVKQLSKKDEDYQAKLINQLIKRKVLIREGEYCRIWIDLLRRYLSTKG